MKSQGRYAAPTAPACLAGVSGVCTHLAAVLFSVETATKVNGADTCTQSKFQLVIPTFQKNIPHLPVKDIDLTSTKAKKG